MIQLNCHNAFQAHTELGLVMSKHRNVITLVQEPYINNKKIIANCPSRYDIFPADKTGRKRVAIFASRHLKLTEINAVSYTHLTLPTIYSV